MGTILYQHDREWVRDNTLTRDARPYRLIRFLIW